MSYFKTLRRKIGVATLVLTCVLMIGWLRSPLTSDGVSVPCFGTGTERLQGVFSLDHHLVWIKTRAAAEEDCGWLPEFPALLLPAYGSAPSVAMRVLLQNIDWCPQSPGFSFGSNVMDYSFPLGGGPIAIRRRFFKIHYFYVVAPLALLSAWLLLSKPRRRNRQEA